MTDFGKDLKHLHLVRADDLFEDGAISPHSEDYAIIYRHEVHKVPAGSRVEIDITGKLCIVTARSGNYFPA